MILKLTYFILLFSAFSGFSQEIKYSLFIKDPCSNKIEKSFNYYLEKDGHKYCISDLDNSPIILPSLGQYNLVATEIGEKHKINITKEVNSDTIVMSRIQEYLLTPNKTGYLFRNCDNPLNGKATSYYSDGSIQMEGNFRNGLAIGDLKRFYHNGQIKEISSYNKDGFLISTKQFDENGKVIKE